MHPERTVNDLEAVDSGEIIVNDFAVDASGDDE